MNGSSRSIAIKKNIIASLFLKGISILVSLQVVPLTINYINPTRYGIWLTLSSIVAWLSYFDLGFAHGFRNRFAEAVAKGDMQLAREYVSTTYVVLSLLFSSVFLIAIVVNHFVNWSAILNVDAAYSSELNIVFGILAFFFCLNIVASIFTTMLTANLGYVISQVPRLRRPELAGGSLLDVGVYPLNFALMIFGGEVAKVSSVCTYTDTGVDEQNSATLIYEDGKVAVLNSSMLSLSDRKGIIYGTKGFMIVENINNFESLTVYDQDRREIKHIDCPPQISGYEYEVEACIRALEEGRLECPQMPHAETIRVMKMMDAMRAEWGIRYPFE